jgi:hypothetical protein
MVASGVHVLLGYKISEDDLRDQFEDQFEEYIVPLKEAEDKKKRKKKEDRYVYKFCKYEFDKYLNFLFYGPYNRTHPSICDSLPCCEYDDDNNDWIIGLRICYFDGYGLDPCDLSSILNCKAKKKTVKQIFKKLGLEAICDDDEPEFYSIANDCRNCT